MRIKSAKSGQITDEMKFVAEEEGVDPEFIRKGIASGRIVIANNLKRENVKPMGIGKGLRVKINSNIGSSQKKCDLEYELNKAKISVKYGADSVMDLSSGPTEADIKDIRKRILDEVHVPIGTVPMYQAAMRAIEKKGGIINMDEDIMFGVVEEQAKEGVDFFTIHTGVTLEIAQYITKHPRMMGIVSRGGTIMAVWMLKNEQENPYYNNFDYLLEMAKEYDFGLSLGDGFRPGCIFDSTDTSQIHELLTLGKLVRRAREKDVGVFVEGPGHIPADQIAENIKIQKALCDEAPFYVLGPLTTDVAPGYDHIVSAIGGTIAGMAGADFLCYVTPAEHLGLPTLEEVKEGIIATRIAAHSVDVAFRRPKALEWDRKMDIARKELNWTDQISIAMDPEKAKRIRERDGPIERKEPCTMCGRLCSIKILKDAMESNKE